ncbi:MAG: hypothetical protein H0X50_01470 [Nitrosopumilus sp.]|nr:hypothetical protein [Nitrosopumilus sp.]
MNINVDLSFFPRHLVQIVINSIEIKPFFAIDHQSSNNTSSNKNNKNNSSSSQQISDSTTYTFEFPGNLTEFEDLLGQILQKNSIQGYVVAQDTEKQNTLTLLKKGDLEQLGILICIFCGASFNSEDEKNIHQRMHYLF